MRKIFEVELGSQAEYYTRLTLPAMPHAMLDALERLRLADGEAPTWNVLSVFNCDRIADFMDEDGSLPELNALCQQLSLLDDRQLTIVEGLAKMEYEKIAQPVSLPQLIDMAHSTDRCHLVEEAANDSELGRFCAETGFVPEADNLSDEAFELLDFASIGREFRQNEGGVFTSGGYVQKHDELRQVYGTLDLTLKKPDYTILAVTSSGCEVEFPLPANEPMGTELVRCVDCAAPALIGLSGGMEHMDLLARWLLSMEKMGKLTKFKAVIETTGCNEICRALVLANDLDEYAFSPRLSKPDKAARFHLSRVLPEEELERLLPHMNLWQYGQEIIEEMDGQLTGYGLIRPAGRGQEQTPSQSGMEMM